jgi:predicted dehydrogenase
VDLVGICSASGLSAHHAAKKFAFDYACESEDQLLSDGDVNTIAVLTRHGMHAEQVVAALQAGKHVFCEKPLAVNPEQLADVHQQLLEAEQALLAVGFNRRFAPLAQKLHAFIAERTEPLVAHYRVNAGYLPATHWLHDPQQGGGRIVGEGCHFVDFLVYLVGALPQAVRARALPDLGRYREDNVVLTFTFPDGSLGSITYVANGDKAFSKERVEVFTSGRVAVLDDFRRFQAVHRGQRKTARSRFRQDKGHGAIWEAFAEAITTHGEPPIPYDQLFGVASATFAALDALRSGQQVVIDYSL